VNDATQEAYKSAIRGNFSKLMMLAKQGDAVKLNDSVYKRVFKRNETTGFTMNLFGLTEIGFTESLNSRLEVKAENGEISLFTGDASDTSITKLGKEVRTVRTSNVVNMVGAGEDETGLTISMTYFDDDLKKKEIKQNLKALTSRQLIDKAAEDRALAAYKTQYQKKGGNIFIRAVVTLSAKDLKDLLYYVAQKGEMALVKEAWRAQLDSLVAYGKVKSLLKIMRNELDEDDLFKCVVILDGMGPGDKIEHLELLEALFLMVIRPEPQSLPKT
jgi:hypothetical protein